MPGHASAEAEQQDSVEDAGQGDGHDDGLADAGDVAASVLDALRDGLEAGQEERGGRQDGEDAAEHGVVGEAFLDGAVIVGLQVLGGAADDRGDSADDTSRDQEHAEELLHASGGSQAAHVQREQQEGADDADDDGDQIDIGVIDVVQRGTGLQAGDQVVQDVGDLDGFPGDDGDERAEGHPAGDHSDLFIEGLVCEGHAAAGDREHRDELAVAQGDGHHHDQSDQVTKASGHGAAGVGHPVVDGNGPADADDGAEADAEEVERADFLLGVGTITHNLPLFCCRPLSGRYGCFLSCYSKKILPCGSRPSFLRVPSAFW